jgi:hypothetical protein
LFYPLNYGNNDNCDFRFAKPMVIGSPNNCKSMDFGVADCKQQHCGLCARYTRNGENVPSGNRDPETGITPMDNFVCWRCQSPY